MRRANLEILGLANAGADLRVDASAYSALDLVAFANAIKLGGGKLVLYNTDSHPYMNLLSLVNILKARVILE